MSMMIWTMTHMITRSYLVQDQAEEKCLDDWDPVVRVSVDTMA
jgi:hypothetical protein